MLKEGYRLIIYKEYNSKNKRGEDCHLHFEQPRLLGSQKFSLKYKTIFIKESY